MTFSDLAFLFQQNAMQRRLLRDYLSYLRGQDAFGEVVHWLPIMDRLHGEARNITDQAFSAEFDRLEAYRAHVGAGVYAFSVAENYPLAFAL